MNKIFPCFISIILPIVSAAAEAPFMQTSAAATAPAVIEQQANQVAQQGEKPCAQMTRPANELQGNTEKTAPLAEDQINSLSGELFAKGTQATHRGRSTTEDNPTIKASKEARR